MSNNTLAGVMSVLFIVLGIMGAAVYIYHVSYGAKAITLDIHTAKEYLWRARSAVDLDKQADYMQEALESLDNRHGNPNWIWHLPDTDFELIKSDLQTNIDASREIASNETKGSYGYQRAIDNIEEICIELNEHLDVTINWSASYTPVNVVLNIVLWIVWLLAGIIAIAAG